MSEIATGVTSGLLTRAADVTLKERRPLVLMVRETPLHLGHLRTMVALAEMGAIIAPPLPALYAQPAVDRGDDRPVGRPRARPVRPRMERRPALGRGPGRNRRRDGLSIWPRVDAAPTPSRRSSVSAWRCRTRTASRVSYLLWALWAGEQGAVVDAGLAARAAALALEWEANVLRPLRAARRALKGIAAVDAQARDAARARV